MSKDPRLPLNVFSTKQKVTYHFFQVLDHFLSRAVTGKLLGKYRYQAFLNLKNTLETKESSRIIPVERRKDLSVEAFKNHYVKNGIPVVLESFAKNWECCKRWTPEFIKEKYGNDEVPIVDAIYLEKGIHYRKLSEIIDEVLQGNNAYLRFYNFLHRHPERYQDFDVDWLKSLKHTNAYVEFTQFFIGGANSVTGLHNSHADNLFIQVYGEKEWYLYPQYYTPLIDPPSTTGGTFRVAPKRGKFGQPFNPFNPDYEDYPLFKYIDGYRVVLQPGDVFYNPPYMWHTVRNTQESIGLGYRWVSPISAFKASPLYYMLDLCAFRPSYFKAYKWHREDSNKEFIYAQKMLEKHKQKIEKSKKKVLT